MRYHLVSMAVVGFVMAGGLARAGAETAEPAAAKAAIAGLINDLKSETPQTRIAAADATTNPGDAIAWALHVLKKAPTRRRAPSRRR